MSWCLLVAETRRRGGERGCTGRLSSNTVTSQRTVLNHGRPAAGTLSPAAAVSTMSRQEIVWPAVEQCDDTTQITPFFTSPLMTDVLHVDFTPTHTGSLRDPTLSL